MGTASVNFKCAQYLHRTLSSLNHTPWCQFCTAAFDVRAKSVVTRRHSAGHDTPALPAVAGMAACHQKRCGGAAQTSFVPFSDTFFLRDLLVDVRRQHPVVVVVVKVVRLLAGHRYLAQPLHHPAANVPRHENPHREPVVRRQPPAVLLVRQHNVVAGVHGCGQGHRRSIRPVLPLWQLARRAAIAHEIRALLGTLHSRVLQDITQPDACPVRARRRPRSPVETDRLFDHVLLFPSVARARDSDGDGDGRELDEFVHAQRDRVLHEAANLNAMCPPVQFGDGTMVANLTKSMYVHWFQ